MISADAVAYGFVATTRGSWLRISGVNLSNRNPSRTPPWQNLIDLTAGRHSVRTLTRSATAGTCEARLLETRNILLSSDSAAVLMTIDFGRALMAEKWGHKGCDLVGSGLGKGDEWRVLGNMVVDSVGVEPRWVRSAGFEEAWEEVGLREGARL